MLRKIRIITALVALCAGVVLSSCSTKRYQVYTVKAPALTEAGNVLVFENEDCRIHYNLWGYRGTLNYVFENKTDKDIYVQMPKSFFILNGRAYNYYDDVEYHKGVSQNISVGESVLAILAGGLPNYGVASVSIWSGISNKRIGVNSSITERAAKIVCIPARSYKGMKSFDLNATRIKTCDKKTDYPDEASMVGMYTEWNSPLSFRNRLSYSFDEEGKGAKVIDNQFYVSEIRNYTEGTATQAVKQDYRCESEPTEESFKTYKVFRVAGPNKFYIDYSDRRY